MRRTVLLLIGATTLQVAFATKVLTADGVKAANAGIATSELIEANEKTVNDIYLATIGKDVDGFTNAQASELFAIANQCPMVGGNAVFKARSLYWLIDDTYEFDDQLLCLPYGIIVKSLPAHAAKAVNIVPNPASTEATLVLTQHFEEAAKLIFNDLLGSEVIRYAVPADVARYTFSTQKLAPALYHFRVLTTDGAAGHGKLSVVH